MGSPTLGVFVTVLVLLSGTAVAVFDGYDGMPRPAGMDQDPTTTYGPKPAVDYDNKVADCIWYGWENGNYPPVGTKNCSASLWASLSHSNPASLAAFMYYAPLEDIYFDPAYNEYLCTIGCFDLSASPPTNTPAADSPGAGSLPPVAAPPVDSAPPPVTTTPPPSPTVLAPPPPATLFRPPPPATPLPPTPTPASVVMPPSEGAPSPMSSPSSSPSSTPSSSAGSSPGSSPSSSPGSSTGASVPGPSVVQAGSGTTSSVSTVLVFTVALFLSINFLV